MLWSEFKTMVDELLAVERRRLGVQPFIDRQIRLGVGEIQRLIEYYRGGVTTTYEFDDVTRDGYASRLELPKGASLREIYHVKTGKIWVRRPLFEYPFSNRHDLRAGVLGIGYNNPQFRYALDHRAGARDLWIYPKLTKGYAVQVVWDSVLGRGEINFKDTDEVPFDEPVANLVHEWVKMKLSREVDKDLATAHDYERTFRLGVSSLYADVQERLRLKRTPSDADCLPGVNCGTIQTTPCGTNTFTPIGACGCDSSSYGGYGSCPQILMPQAEWVMVGDSGVRDLIEDTIAVATAIKAVDPSFVIHLGDATYQTTIRPGQNGSEAAIPLQMGGSAHLIRDLFVKHYWNFWDCRIYLALGNHDLDTDYGNPTIDAIPNVKAMIGADKQAAHKLWYTFSHGPVRFIVLNSGFEDDDANIHATEQLEFVQAVCAAATEPWLIAVFHRPAYSSDILHHPGSALMRTLTDQMAALGVDLVVNGHCHNYERVQDANGLMHVICGLGGAQKRGLADSDFPAGSQIFYSDQNGFLHFKADADVLQWELRTVDNEVIDRVTLKKTSAVCDGLEDPSTNSCNSCNQIPAMYQSCCGIRTINQVEHGGSYPTHPPYNQNEGALWYGNNGAVYGWDTTLKTWIVLNGGSGSGGGVLTGSIAPEGVVPAAEGQIYSLITPTVRELWLKSGGGVTATGWELFVKTL
jgi:hypothetical protein